MSEKFKIEKEGKIFRRCSHSYIEERFFLMTKILNFAAICNKKRFSEWAHSYDFYYRPINERKEDRVIIKSRPGLIKKHLEPDFKDGKKLIYTFAKEVPQGEFEFWSFSLFPNLGYFQIIDRPKRFFVPLECESGKINCFGNITFYPGITLTDT